MAVMEIDSTSCRILLSGLDDWMQIDLSALETLTALGGTVIHNLGRTGHG
jgi:hypothetical protein